MVLYNLTSLSLDKVTTGTYNLQVVIVSVAPIGALSLAGGLVTTITLCSKVVITQFLFHFNSKDTSELINGYLVLSKSFLGILMV